MLVLWRALPVTGCKMGALSSFVHTKDHNLPCVKIYRETYGDA